MSSHLLYPRSPKSIEMFLADYNINRETDIDYFLIHQANKMIVERIVKKLKLPKTKVPCNLEEFENLSCWNSLDPIRTISYMQRLTFTTGPCLTNSMLYGMHGLILAACLPEPRRSPF